MKQLKLGKITLEELADWFGIASSTIRAKSAKEKKLEILKSFADYHIKGRTIYIDKIYIPEYNKAFHVIKSKLPEEWHENGIDTSARVGVAIYSKYPEVSSQIQMSTAKAYANKAKIELFGRNHIDTDRGELGTSRYIWGIVTETGDNLPLTEEQQKIVSACAQEAYGSILGDRAALLNDALNKQEITEQEYNQSMTLTKEERATAYGNFELNVMKKLGFMPMRLTQITYWNFFEESCAESL